MRTKAAIRSISRHRTVAAGLAAGSYNLAPTSNTGHAFGFVSAGGSSAADAYGAAARATTFNTAVGDKSASVSSISVSIGQYVAVNSVDGGFDSQVWEGFLEFDTQLQAGRSISAASLSLFISSDQSATNFTIQVVTKNFGTGVDISDYVPGGAGNTLSASPIAGLSTIFTSSNNSFTLGTDISGSINTSGKTQLMLYSSRTQTNTTPTTGSNEYVVINPSSCRLNLTVA